MHNYTRYNISYLQQDKKMLFDPPQLHGYSQALMTDIPLIERQSIGDDYLSTSLGFFSVPLRKYFICNLGTFLLYMCNG